jgi:predicted outer membrane protein
MKWFGMGTAVMALMISSSALMAGQERPQGSPGQSPQGGGQASPGSPGKNNPGSPGQSTPGSPRPGSTGQSTQGDRSSQRESTTGQADAQGFINDMTIANLAEVQLGQMASEKASNADVKSFGQMMVKDHTKANSELKQIASQLSVQPTTELDQKHKDLSDKLSRLSGSEFDREYINAMVMGHEEVLGKLRARAGAGVSGAHGAAGATGDHSTTGGGDRSSTPDNRNGAGRLQRDQPNTTDNSSRPTQDPAAARSQAGKGATTSGAHGEQALTQWAAKTMPVVEKHLERARDIQKKVAK